MAPVHYVFGFVPSLLSFIAIWVGGGWSLLAPIVIFGAAPLYELFFRGTTENHLPEEEAQMRDNRWYDVVIYSAVVVQYALLFYFLYRIGFTSVLWWEVIGMSLSMGMSCGILGINCGHELGHRRKKSEQNMAKALLLTSLYTHFFIEHNRGHHARVSTEADPASARYGEWLWTFIPRSMIGGYRSAWQLEEDRLSLRGEKVFTWKNEMVRLTVLQLAFVLAIFLVFGGLATLSFLLAAFCGGVLLETVNYIEHYGLERQVQENGQYERVLPIHSWNANQPLGRYLLFELSRHSDHHAHARRKYQVLRHFDDSPQMPTGYPGMMVLAWFPPLWFAVVHKHMLSERQRVKTMGARTAVAANVEMSVMSGSSHAQRS